MAIDVETYMSKLEHPLKAEIEALRDIIQSVDPDIAEEIKWSAPSFSFGGEYLVTFNPRRTEQVHLVFHNPATPLVQSDILEGDYADGRRMAYFENMKAVIARQAAVRHVVRSLVEHIRSSAVSAEG